MDSVLQNLQGALHRVAAADAAKKHCLSDQTTLIAVTKTVSVEKILCAVNAGQRHFGENYIQEGVEKILALKPLHSDLTWHMIGAVQSNKTRLVAEHYDWIHTIDRLKIAQRLSEQRPLHLAPLNCLIQVNVDDESTKAGVGIGGLQALVQSVSELPQLKLRGLMCIPAKNSTAAFGRMRSLLVACNTGCMSMDSLSMGMSSDYEQAILCGATHVRIGSAIFGARVV